MSSEEELREIGQLLLRPLEEMDREATKPYKDRPHGGLGVDAWYVDDVPLGRYEIAWEKALCGRLNQHGYHSAWQVPFPQDPRKKCDIVTSVDGKKMWIELKSAWKAWIDEKNTFRTNNRSFKPYLFGKGKTHSAAGDIRKLETLTKPDADYLGGLLVGFDSVTDPMDPEVSERIAEMDMIDKGWEVAGPHTWADLNNPACRHACWFWFREAAG
jgi:hypothetical protein